MEKSIKDYVIDFADIPYQRISIERVLTGFRDLDYFNKGIEVGVTEIVGDTNTGKSILTSALLDSAIRQQYKCGVFAGEHTLSKYKMLIMQQNAKQGEFELVPFVDKHKIYNDSEDTNIADWYVNQEREKKVNDKYNHKLFLFDVRRTERDVDTLCSFMEHCYKEFGVRFFVIDNLMEIENNKDNQFQEQTEITTKIRNTALRYQLFVCLVMHTNKAAGADGFRLTVKNAFGSSNITNKGYNVWFLYRKDQITTFNKNEKVLDKFKKDCVGCGYDFDKCDGFIEVGKTKGVGNGVVGIVYDSDSKTFKQAPKVSKTEADKIYKKYEKKEKERGEQATIEWSQMKDGLTPISEDDPFGDELPF